MLKISLDEAYVFDLLSIHEVKLMKSGGDKRKQLEKTYDKLKEEIISQIGHEKYTKIVVSPEYHDLKISNAIVFMLVDRSNQSELSKLTADANYDRYIKKTTLQNKFFGNNLDEVKL
jgi:hypothetical protein